MFWLKPKTQDEKIIKLIKNQPDSSFAKNEIKFKLLSSLPVQEKSIPHAGKFMIPRYALAGALAVLAIAFTSTAALANSALPGDKLYALNLFGENVALKIAPTPEIKAQLQTKFVTKRAKELNLLSQKVNHQEQKIQAVRRSVKSLNQAIEAVSNSRNRMKTQGNDESAARLNKILNNLQELAETHEHETNEIRMHIDNEELKIRLDENLDEIRQAKIKVRLELREEKQEKDDLLP